MKAMQWGVMACVLAMLVACKTSPRADQPMESRVRLTAYVQTLIDDLGSADPAVSHAAREDLATLGDAAHSELSIAATSHEDPRVRRLASGIAVEIELAESRRRHPTFDRSLTDETSWSVSAFWHNAPAMPHPTPWTFHADGTANAGTSWYARWRPAGQRHIRFIADDGEYDIFFLGTNTFFAVRDGLAYRLGRRVIPGDEKRSDVQFHPQVWHE